MRLRPRRRPVQPGHRGRPRRLHPLRPVHPGVRRHPGQRRDRAQRKGLRHAHRVRPQRPDGRLVLRIVRRVRGRLPDRRADEQADPRHPDPAAHRTRRGGHRLPVLRRGLRADLLRGSGARRDRLRRRPGTARIAGPALRQGPVRLGLRRVAAAPDDAADPPRGVLPQGRAVRRRPRRHDRRRRGQRPRDDERRRPEAEAQGRQARPQARRPRRLRRGAAALPGGQLGRGAGPGGAQAERDLRRGRAGRHRRVRQREVLERGGLPLPEAHPHRLPHQQRGPLHPAVPRLQRGRAVRGDRLRSGLHHLRRHQERRGRDRHRQQLDREPPGRLQLLQAGPAQRHDHHLRGPAGRQDGRPRGHLLPAQARHRRRLLQRDHARGHQARPDRRRLHRQPDLQLRGARGARSPTTRRSAPSRSPACPPT